MTFEVRNSGRIGRYDTKNCRVERDFSVVYVEIT